MGMEVIWIEHASSSTLFSVYCAEYATTFDIITVSDVKSYLYPATFRSLDRKKLCIYIKLHYALISEDVPATSYM